MKGWKRPLTAMLALSMAAVPCQAFASESTDFTYTDEQLARMQDNNMDYDELAWLIDKYNATVLNNKQKFSDFKKDYGLTKDDVSEAYRDLADELENNLSGEDDAGSLISDLGMDTRVQNLRETADDNLEDSAVIWWGYEEARDNLVVVAQSNMISYQKSLLDLEVKRKNAELLEAEYNLAQAKRGAQTVTDMEVLNAKESMLNAQAAVTTLEASIRETKQKLCVMTGWSYNAEPVIGEIPEPDWDRVDTINPEADRQAALENNYTLKINKRKLENATADNTKTTLKQTIRENEEQIGVSLATAAKNVQAAKIAYDQAVSTKDLEEKNLALASVKIQAGTIRPIDYQEQEYKTLSSQAAEKTAKMELFEAIETYEWAVKGLAEA
ncbi:TolC family protein [Clostridium sp. AM58-1XD]|uniref:TolC family protein n=1 Tax=Clostridium sp. AM58-1XD TaxID=2292307 RepID=UPI000E52C467|nr:TolC family protein [Clostridium sp. AM58-1XD]RGY96926.1 TolC family protein [Clostridium sp. AM58-1XD]